MRHSVYKVLIRFYNYDYTLLFTLMYNVNKYLYIQVPIYFS